MKVEWIDDTSANILYENENAALEALRAFSAFSGTGAGGSFDEGSDPAISTLDLRPAKPHSRHPGVQLLVRQAVTTDVKRPRAHEASRFYLLNPDKDPWERRRMKQEQRQRGGRDKGRRRGRGGDGGYEEGEEGEDEDAAVPFDVNMYDDDAGAADERDGGVDGRVKRRSRSRRYSSDGRQRSGWLGTNGTQRNGDLFDRRDRALHGTRGGGVLRRDRSLSPDECDSLDDSRESGYGRLGYEDTRAERSRKRSRRRSTPPPVERPNAGKELFPTSGSGAATTLLQSDEKASALTPSLSTSSPSSRKRPRELFPNKTNVSNHRRTAAFDAADETAEIYSPKKRSVFSENSYGSGQSESGRLSRDLSSRISHDGVQDKNGARGRLSMDVDGGDEVGDGMETDMGVRSRGRGRGSRNGRAAGMTASAIPTMLLSSSSATSTQPGFSIRGVADTVRGAADTATAGFSIQGAAGGHANANADAARPGPKDLSVKDLFPNKVGALSSASSTSTTTTMTNAGKELFGQKMRGRGAAQRQRAQDMYF